MDPFMIATSLAGLLNLTIELMKLSHSYFAEASNSSDKIQASGGP